MQQYKATILLAEDDNSLAYMIKDALEEEQFKVVHCADGKTAIDVFDKGKFDICLLDIMMPNRDGYAVAKKIRQQSDVIPILFLSTKREESDKLTGYDTGADDYLTKPFSLNELIRKIDVFLRRTKRESVVQNEYQLSATFFYPKDLRLKLPEGELTITQKEADLLTYLCNNVNKVVKREEVLMNVWGKDDYFLGRSMDVYISKLRKYLKADSSIVLETLHGIGFRLTVE